MGIEEMFDEAMRRNYTDAVKIGYNPTKFLQMVNELGGVETAHRLLKSTSVSDGFSKLWELGRLDLAVEAVIVDHPEYHGFFTGEELTEARNRLAKLDYQSKVDHPDPTDQSWTTVELQATVEAYLWMLEREQASEPYVKAEVNRRLRSGLLARRNRQSIEFRMCNISSVLHEAGRPYIAGYKPRSNVGAGKAAEIEDVLSKASAAEPIAIIATADQRDLDKQVEVLLRNPDMPKPEGNVAPQLDEVTRKEHKRNADVKAWVLRQANGKCELCGENGPFTNSQGQHYLEVHHVKLLADGGPDTTENAVGLCPNCHRRCHYSSDRKSAVGQLYQQVTRLVN